MLGFRIPEIWISLTGEIQQHLLMGSDWAKMHGNKVTLPYLQHFRPQHEQVEYKV
jgi:hypothetical protein